MPGEVLGDRSVGGDTLGIVFRGKTRSSAVLKPGSSKCSVKKPGGHPNAELGPPKVSCWFSGNLGFSVLLTSTVTLHVSLP